MPDLDEPEWSVTDPSALLLADLDYYRDTVRRKFAGLTDEQLRTSVLPSGWTPLELGQHLAFMERRWTQWGFAAQAVPDPAGDDDPVTGHWFVPEGDGPAEVLARIAAAGARTRELMTGVDLTTPAETGGRFPAGGPTPSAGWILLHVLQEYARHAGHLDAAREIIDGAVGE
jgi:hypothetical protein